MCVINQLLDPTSQKFVQLSFVMNCFFQSMTTLRQGQSVYLSREGHIKKDFCIFGLFFSIFSSGYISICRCKSDIQQCARSFSLSNLYIILLKKCLRVFTVIANLSETTPGMSQKLGRINVIKLLIMPFSIVHIFYRKGEKWCFCNKFCWMVTFATFLLKYLVFFCQIDWI